MSLDRRDFLKSSLATGSMVAWGLTVPTFLSRAAAAAPTSEKRGARDTVLGVVQLTGGQDRMVVRANKNDELAVMLAARGVVTFKQVRRDGPEALRDVIAA